MAGMRAAIAAGRFADFKVATKAQWERGDIWIKVCGAERISMPPYAEAVPIAQALWSRRRRTRVLWGTDFPHPNATHEADEADLVDLVPQ